MVNLGKQHLNKFINSGALLSTPRGTYFVGIGLSGTMEPNCACFYAQEFFTQPKAFKCEQFLELTKEKLCEFLSLMPSRQDVLKFKEANKEHFLKSFKLLKSGIEKGELKKAVPYAATGFNGELGFENKLFCIKNLILNHEPQNYLYFFSQNDQGFCGITPELLFSFKDHQFKTMALAGTAPVGISKEEFLNNKKEVSEHQYVVEFLRQKLSSLGDFNFSPMQVKAQGAIGHLLTLVEGELPQIDYFEIINLMHPTPALGGLPQNKALEFLKILNEELPRFHFGAPFGVVSSKEEALSVVLIRGLFWQKQSAFIGAGCGVVLESEFEKEWNELNLKINATKKNLGILN